MTYAAQPLPTDIHAAYPLIHLIDAPNGRNTESIPSLVHEESPIPFMVTFDHTLRSSLFIAYSNKEILNPTAAEKCVCFD